MMSILNRYNNLTQRLITALIGAFVLIFCVVYSQWTYFAVFLFVTIIAQFEFYKLIESNGIVPLKYLGTFSGALIFILSFLVESSVLPSNWYYCIFPVVSLIYFIKLYKRDEENPFTNIGFTFLGILYIALPFALFNIIAFSHETYSYQLILGPLLLLWASDTGAYFAGVNFGKTKLFERVSPKKSWEGSMGGAITSILMAYVLSMYFLDMMLWQWMVVAGIIIIAGTYGDLVESLFKRSMEIKDSGTKLPGHGGFLDRFDGLLLSVPFIIIFFKLLK
ncbi:MAG: phosphatidate cytidylyltransferase [Cyclobacteriaceae bacterium]